MRKYKLALLGVVCTIQVWAQNESDVLRYSQQYTLGTARSQGVGGAFGAVGADFSSSYLNPAGMAFYRRNELHFSTAITANIASSDYLGTTQKDSRTGFNLPSFGIVLTNVNTGLNGDATTGIVNYNFAFGQNRTNDFQQNVYMRGYNTRSHISQFYVQQANGIASGDFGSDDNAGSLADMAWNAYLIDTADNNTTYYSPWFEGDNDYRILQTQRITRRGAMNEYNFNFSANVGNVLYVGAGLILGNVRHEFTTEFTESDPDRTVNNTLGHTYNSSTLRTVTEATGGGVAGRFGIIIRPVDVFRFGISAQTPMRISMSEQYGQSVSSDINWTGIGVIPGSEARFSNNYDIVTPARYTLSAAFMLPSLGFLSADLDVLDYRDARYSSDFSYHDDMVNRATRNAFRKAYQFRIGSEIKASEHYRVRLGYNIGTSPYSSGLNGVDTDKLVRTGYSLGFGYTDGVVFVDLAGVMTTFKEYNTPYTVSNGFSPTAEITNNMYNVVLTAGYRF